MAASDKLRWRWQCHFVLGWRQRQRHACWLPRPPPGFGRCAVGGFEWRRAPKLRWTYRSPGQARAADHGSRNVEVKAEVLHVQVRRGLSRTRMALCRRTFYGLARRKPVRACRVRTIRILALAGRGSVPKVRHQAPTIMCIRFLRSRAAETSAGMPRGNGGGLALAGRSSVPKVRHQAPTSILYSMMRIMIRTSTETSVPDDMFLC